MLLIHLFIPNIGWLLRKPTMDFDDVKSKAIFFVTSSTVCLIIVSHVGDVVVVATLHMYPTCWICHLSGTETRTHAPHAHAAYTGCYLTYVQSAECVYSKHRMVQGNLNLHV